MAAQQQIVETLRRARERIEHLEQMHGEPLAIVGMGCRFPGGASSPAEFWNLLSQGADATSDVPGDRWNMDAFFDPDPEAPGKMYARRGGFLDRVDEFDPAFFNITEREAAALDPQQRLLLEVSWEALEDANIVPRALRGTATGVFMGASWHDYERIAFGRDDAGRVDAYSGLGNTPSIIAGRIAYVLGTQGPTMMLDTSCSASLVAVHQACLSLRTGECATALAGGVALMLSPLSTVFCCKIRALSPTGKCHSFDAAADGYLRGEGAGVVVLKRLSDALASGHRVLAVIRGSAINHDGASSGLTVPNGRAQESLLMAALKNAGIAAADLGYVEAHGTGTPLGDPIELAALAKVYGAGRDVRNPLPIGSVKTNIGHLEAAAGIAGLIKAVLMVQHQCIPASLNFSNPNPRFDWRQSGLRVPTKSAACDRPLMFAGVSSFGFSGTNAHVIIGCAPPLPPSSAEAAAASSAAAAGASLVVLSGRSEAALVAQAERFGAFIAARPELALADIGFTANAGRSAFEHRAAWVVRDTADLVEQLGAFASGQERPSWGRGVYRNRPPRVAMLFTGQGAQYSGMGRELYAGEPVFRAAIDECAGLLEGQLDIGLVALLHEAGADLLDRTDLTQPALFALAYALRRTWAAWGVTPDVVLGHSVGEYAAAQAAGVFSLADGLRLVAARGRLMRRCCRPGAMLSIAADAAVVAGALAREAEVEAGEAGAGLALAAVNGPLQHVVAGERAAIERLQARLAEQGVRAEVLPGSHAFHSSLIEPMLAPFAEVLASVTLSPPTMPLVSNARATVVGAEMADPAYWIEHTRAPVQFARSLERLPQHGIDALLEIGPRPTLTALARHTLDDQHLTMLASLRAGRSDTEQMLESLAALHVRGTKVDWNGFHRNRNARKITLPTYPFQRQRHWVEHTNQDTADLQNGAPSGLGTRMVLASSGAGSGIAFELRCDARTHPFLKDHRVLGATLVPGAFYVAIALQAAGEIMSGGFPEIVDLVLQAPMTLADRESRIVQLLVPNVSDREPKFTIHSRDAHASGAPVWTEHARGSFSRSGDVRAPVLRAVDTHRCRTIDGSALRHQFAERGLAYEGAFTSLSTGRFDDFGADVELACATHLTNRSSGILLHPGFLDSALQSTAACGAYQNLRGAYVPLGFERVAWHSPAQPFLPARATVDLLPFNQRNADTLRADLRIYDRDGAAIMSITGMTLRRLQDRVPDRNAEGRTPEMFQLDWVPDDGQSAAQPLAGDWIVVGAEHDRACIVEQFVRASPQATVTVLNDDASRTTILAAMKKIGGPLQGIVSMVPGLGSTADPQTCSALARVGAAIADLATAASDMPIGDRFALWLVTAGAQTVPGDRCSGAPTAGAVAAIGRSVGKEYPDLRCINVDLPPRPLDASAGAALWQELQRSDGETDVVLRSRRYRLRMRPGTDEDPLVRPTGAFRVTAAPDGRVESVRIVPMERRDLRPREVEIEVAAAGLNFRDVLRVLGKLPIDAAGIGGECSGIVRSVGRAVTRFKVGDRVMAMADASFASRVAVDERFVARIPDHWSFDAAATVPVAFLTAYHGLSVLGRLEPGQSILIHSAASGVGLAAVQLAQKLGLRVFATASIAKWSVLRRLGVEDVFDSRTLDFRDAIAAETQGRGVDAVLNALTGEFIPAGLHILSENGIFLELGKVGTWDPQRVAAVHPTARYRPFDIADVPADETATMLSDLSDMFARGELQPLPATFYPVSSVKAACRTMAQGRHVGKLVLRMYDGIDAGLAPGATYVVTGASGALGESSARWLIENGARHLVLVARKANAATDALAESCVAAGVKCAFIAADLTSAGDVERLFATLDGHWPPLRGIFHAAGALDDVPLANMDFTHMMRALLPKVESARLLHRRTLRMRLDFFVLYSSIASVLGSAGQANYAAANGYLDSLAHLRRKNGLAGLSVNWGGWHGAGMAGRATQQTRDRWEEQGQFLLQPSAGLEAMALALGSPTAQTIIVAADWNPIARTRTPVPSLLRDIIDSRGSATETEGKAPDPIASLASSDLLRLTDAAVRRVTGTRATTFLDPHLPLRDIGLDSLMAVELRNELCAATGLRLAAAIAFDHPTIDDLVRHLRTLVGESPSAEVADEASGSASRTAEPDAPPRSNIEGVPEAEMLERLEREIVLVEATLS